MAGMSGMSVIVRQWCAACSASLCAAAFVVSVHADVHTQHQQGRDQVLAPGYQPLDYTAPEAGSYQLPALGAAADGVLLNSHGTQLQLTELYGDRIVVLSFIYTSCNDVNGCPLATYVLSQLQNRLSREPDLLDQVRLITVSFDPVNDTPSVMEDYRSRIGKPEVEWHFLTAESEAALAPLLEDFGQSIRKDYDEQGNYTGSFSHVLRVYLIDRLARIRNIYSVSFLHADTLMSDIKTLLLFAARPQAATAAISGREGADDNSQGYAAGDDQSRSRSLVNRQGRPADLMKLVDNPPLGLPPVPFPEDNPITPAKVQLGRKLFYDRRLSHNNTISCAICHVPEQGYTANEMATAVGIEGRSMRRNAPTLYNIAYATRLFHDGRETSLEQQVWGPLLATNEMGNPAVGYVVERLRTLPDYHGLFEDAFNGRGPGMETIGMAIASYERTLVSADSAFDRWYFGNQPDALTAAQKNGFALFDGKAGCSRCHRIGSGEALFSDNEMHNTGIGYQAAFAMPAAAPVQAAPGATNASPAFLAGRRNDLGRYEVSQDPADRWKYKTPSLRNIAFTQPYMHDGSISSLRGVLEFYNAGGIANQDLDPLLQPLSLTTGEIDDLVAFLGSLSGDNIDLLVADAFAAPVGDP